MSLQIELDELYRGFTKKVPPDVLDTMLNATRRLVESGIADKSLKVGDSLRRDCIDQLGIDHVDRIHRRLGQGQVGEDCSVVVFD